MALQDSPDVQTRSSGEGPLKRAIYSSAAVRNGTRGIGEGRNLS